LNDQGSSVTAKAARAAALIRLDDLVNEEHSVAETMPRERLAMVREREEVVVKLVLGAIAGRKG